MNCCKCGRCFNVCNGMIPIDPKGTEGRRWSCTDCLSESEVASIPPDVREMSELINSDFMGRNK